MYGQLPYYKTFEKSSTTTHDAPCQLPPIRKMAAQNAKMASEKGLEVECFLDSL